MVAVIFWQGWLGVRWEVGFLICLAANTLPLLLLPSLSQRQSPWPVTTSPIAQTETAAQARANRPETKEFLGSRKIILKTLAL